MGTAFKSWSVLCYQELKIHKEKVHIGHTYVFIHLNQQIYANKHKQKLPIKYSLSFSSLYLPVAATHAQWLRWSFG